MNEQIKAGVKKANYSVFSLVISSLCSRNFEKKIRSFWILDLEKN